MIKIGYLVSYDYRMLLDSIPLVYEHADRIFLAVDANRRTWAGNRFTISPSFFEEVKAMDVDHKIAIYEDDFFVEGLEPLALDTRERQMLSDRMGENCWKMQIDADEYCVNFPVFADFLRRNKALLHGRANPINLTATLITLFKRTEKGFFVIVPHDERSPMAFNHPKHEKVRRCAGEHVHTGYMVVHQSWARSGEEILTKIQNWGHKDDFDVMQYFRFWEGLDESNYREYQDFHPMYKGLWKSLEFVPAKNIAELIAHYEKTTNLDKIKPNRKLRIMKAKLFFRNLFKGSY